MVLRAGCPLGDHLGEGVEPPGIGLRAAHGSVVENVGRDRPVHCPLEHLADRRGVSFGRRGLRLGLLPEGGRVEGGRLRAHVPGQGQG